VAPADGARNDGVVIDAIRSRTRRPELFDPSEAPFWDDPYISGELLKTHLDDAQEAASRPATVVQATVERLVRDGVVGPGTRVLDLGCGPGRYAELLASVGAQVTGVDISARSIEYARESAALRGLDIEYRRQDFCTLDDVEAFDVVLQVYGELSTFADPVRDRLLAGIHRALVPGGWLVFDVSTPAHRVRVGQRNGWFVNEGGLWREGPHLVLADGFAYPDDVWCDQFVVAAGDGVTAYRMWFHDYTPQTLTPVLERAGFAVQEMREALDGGPFGGGEWLGVLARAMSLGPDGDVGQAPR
jgi:SAM-dependent methyltransferase